jgi:hypothetical protein
MKEAPKVQQHARTATVQPDSKSAWRVPVLSQPLMPLPKPTSMIVKRDHAKRMYESQIQALRRDPVDNNPPDLPPSTSNAQRVFTKHHATAANNGGGKWKHWKRRKPGRGRQRRMGSKLERSPPPPSPRNQRPTRPQDPANQTQCRSNLADAAEVEFCAAVEESKALIGEIIDILRRGERAIATASEDGIDAAERSLKVLSSVWRNQACAGKPEAPLAESLTQRGQEVAATHHLQLMQTPPKSSPTNDVHSLASGSRCSPFSNGSIDFEHVFDDVPWLGDAAEGHALDQFDLSIENFPPLARSLPEPMALNSTWNRPLMNGPGPPGLPEAGRRGCKTIGVRHGIASDGSPSSTSSSSESSSPESSSSSSSSSYASLSPSVGSSRTNSRSIRHRGEVEPWLDTMPLLQSHDWGGRRGKNSAILMRLYGFDGVHHSNPCLAKVNSPGDSASSPNLRKAMSNISNMGNGQSPRPQTPESCFGDTPRSGENVTRGTASKAPTLTLL